MWPHSFQRPSHCKSWDSSPTWNSPKMATDLCALAMPVWFLKEGFHKGALSQPWPFAGLAGTFSHSEHMEFSFLNSCSVSGHVQHIWLLEWWAFSYPESLPCLGMHRLWSGQHLALFQKRERMEFQEPFTIKHDFQSLWLLSEPHSVHFIQILSVKADTTL